MSSFGGLVVLLFLVACGGGSPGGESPGEPCVADGTGIWVSALTGDDRNPGSRVAPVATIARGIEHATTCGGPVQVGHGDYAESIDLVEGISVLGGFECANAPCGWTRDPVQFVTSIHSQGPVGVSAPATITRATVLDGFTLVGADALGGGGARTIVVLAEGNPTITRNVIHGGRASGSTSSPPGDATGVYVAELAHPLIADNRIIAGTGNQTYFSAVQARNARARGEVRDNVIVVPGGFAGIGVIAGATQVEGNTFELSSAAVGIEAHSGARIDRNAFPCEDACVAVAIRDADVVVTNNTIRLGSIDIVGPSATRSIVINANLIYAPVGIVVDAPTGSLGAGRVRNNIFLLGPYAGGRAAVREARTPGVIATLEAFDHNVVWFADHAQNTTDALWQRWDGATATALTTIEQVNAITTPAASNNRLVDPMVTGDHLAPGSPCIDTGTATDAPATDLDGDARPRGAGFDVGPDEA